MGEIKRDLHADLTLCEKATPGPWIDNGNEIVSPAEPLKGIAGALTDEDNEFIAAAREGWPHAIERAIAAENRVKVAEAENAAIRADLLHSSRTLYEAQRYIDELEAEVKRLRSALAEIAKETGTPYASEAMRALYGVDAE